MTEPTPFTLPEWDRIWAALNKLTEDLPVPEVETRWDKLMSEAYDLMNQLHLLADDIENSLEAVQAERDHNLQMFEDMLGSDDTE